MSPMVQVCGSGSCFRDVFPRHWLGMCQRWALASALQAPDVLPSQLAGLCDVQAGATRVRQNPNRMKASTPPPMTLEVTGSGLEVPAGGIASGLFRERLRYISKGRGRRFTLGLVAVLSMHALSKVHPEKRG